MPINYPTNPYIPSYYYPQNNYMSSAYPNMQQPMASNMNPMQQNYTGTSVVRAMEWVEGEVGAKAFQMPTSWPANQPIPLWDSTDTVIYLKSWNPMGIPNPLQKIKYTLPEQQSFLPSNDVSGTTNPVSMENYATKDDLEKIDKLYHALKSKATYEAMKEYDENDDFEGVSGRRGRDGMGRYISRDMSHEMSRRDWPNYQRDEWSGHYYPPMYYPPNYR